MFNRDTKRYVSSRDTKFGRYSRYIKYGMITYTILFSAACFVMIKKRMDGTYKPKFMWERPSDPRHLAYLERQKKIRDQEGGI